MTDATDIIPVVAYLLQENDTIRGYVDDQIIPGLRHARADDYLDGPNSTCIGVRELSETVGAYVGSASSGEYRADLLFEIFVLSRESEAYAKKVAKAVRNLMLQHTATTYGGASYRFSVFDATRRAVYDPQGLWWQETLTYRIKELPFSVA
jgi:hypothetical protein